MSLAKLDIIDSSTGIVELAEAAYQNEVPGFQVDEDFVRRVGVLPVLDCIELGSQNALGETVPFTDFIPPFTSPIDYPPHADGNIRGLAVHHTKRGLGIVRLTSLIEEEGENTTQVRIFANQPTEAGLQYIEQVGDYGGGGVVENGPVFEGKLVPDRLTVFSEGNVGKLFRAIHSYIRDDGENLWMRYASRIGDADLEPAELQYKSEQFRLEITHDEYRQLLEAKERAEYYKKHRYQFEKLSEEDKKTLGSARAIERMLQVHPGKNIAVIDTGESDDRYLDTSVKQFIHSK